MSVLFSLLLGFLKVGLFSVGGGYAAIPLIQDQIVLEYQLMTAEEFADLVTIAEMTPGPIAINAATFLGMRIAGVPGALLCTFGCILLPVCICLTLGKLYYKYRNLSAADTLLACLRPGVVALIACAALNLFAMAVFQDDPDRLSPTILSLTDLKPIETVLFLGCLFLLRKYKINALWIIWGSGLVGTALYLLL